MASTGLGVTIGSYSLRAVKVRRKRDGGYVVLKVFSDRVNDETRAVAGRALAARGVSGAPATVGLTGRDVIIRYSQVPPVPEWRLRTLMKYEVDEVGSQSGGDVSADYRKLNLPDPEGERTEDTILVALARNKYLDRLLHALAEGGIGVAGSCPNSVALFNAFAVNATYGESETSLLVNIGAEDMDIAIQKGGELLFARNAAAGGRLFTDSIQQAFSTGPGKADQMKVQKADVTPRAHARYADPTAEKVANAIMGAAGQLASMIQSTLMIARAQAKIPDLKVDRVLLAGGGASLKGLDLYLKQAMGVPVERLNPFAVSDLSSLPPEERELAEKAPHEFAVAMGLAQGRLDPLAFPLAVLPAAVKRRRDFLTKGLFGLAASLVAAGILAALYVGRKEASATSRAALRDLEREKKEAERKDGNFRQVLGTAQETAVKHRLIAELMAPGSLLGRTWKVLEENLSVTRDVYLQSVQLKTAESPYTFPFFRERRTDEKATGYEESSRSRGLLRDPIVLVEGRISGRQRADDVYGKFVDGCKTNDQGLLVDTVKRLHGGGGAQDGSFEISFRTGVALKTVVEEGVPPVEIVLTDLALDDPEDPQAILGRRADGLRVSIPLKKLERRQQRELVDELKARGAPAADE